MRTSAAGTFALNCARLGIPCIGYNDIDTQNTCFPLLSVNNGDVHSAKKLARRLVDDIEFNEAILEQAGDYVDQFGEDLFVPTLNNIFDCIYNKKERA